MLDAQTLPLTIHRCAGVLLALALLVASPAFASSSATNLHGKAKLKLESVGKDKAPVVFSMVQIDDTADAGTGRFALEGSVDMSGGTRGKGKKRQLLLAATAVPAVESTLAARVAALLASKGRTSLRVDELAMKRLLAAIADEEKDLTQLETQAAALRQRIARIERLIEAGVEPPSSRAAAVRELARIELSLERQRKSVARLERELADLRAGPAGPLDVRIEITRADLSSKLEKHATRLSVKLAVRFDAVVQGSGERFRGSYKAVARGAAFDVADGDSEVLDPSDLDEIRRKLEELIRDRA